MPRVQFTLIQQEEEASITVFIPGQVMPQVAHSDHPKFDNIVARAFELRQQGDAVTNEELDGLVDLFDISKAVDKRFRRLSERVTVKNGMIYLDGDEIDNALTKQVIRFLDDGVEDWGPLVLFFENVQANPQPHSREQLFKFIAANQITLNEQGMIVAYKGMRSYTDEEGAYFQPTNHGPITVDDEDGNSRDLKQRVGSIVTMPRSVVRHDPSQHCSVGLHIATYNYARGYGSTVVEVEVNPRDVVSVPNDSAEKVRACRYKIIGPVGGEYTSAIRYSAPEPVAEPEPAEEVVATRVETVERDRTTGEETPAAPYADDLAEAEAALERFENEGGPAAPDDEPVEDECPDCGARPDEAGCDLCDPEDEEPEEVVEAVSVNTPSLPQWAGMVALAKGQRKSVKAVAPTRGWQLVGDDPKGRGSWHIPE